MSCKRGHRLGMEGRDLALPRASLPQPFLAISQSMHLKDEIHPWLAESKGSLKQLEVCFFMWDTAVVMEWLLQAPRLP
jgi:hypothetical protein